MVDFGRAKVFAACVLAVMVLTVGVFPSVVKAEQKTMATQRVVLLESCIDTYCVWCYDMMDIYNQLYTDYTPSQIALIMYHIVGAYGPDPWNVPDSNTRATYYGCYGTPWQIVDGKNVIGKMPYSNLATEIDARLAITPAFAISVNGDVSTGSVTVHLEQTGTSSATNLKMRYAVVESNMWIGPCPPECSDGRYYNYTLRKMLPEDSVTLPVKTGGEDWDKSFTVDSKWVGANLSLVAFLQSNTDKQVHQAAMGGLYSAVPEISPLVILPLAGIFTAFFIIIGYGYRQKTAFVRGKQVQE